MALVAMATHLEQVPDVGAQRRARPAGPGRSRRRWRGGRRPAARARSTKSLNREQQPDRLVVDAEVEVDRAPVVVAQHDQPAEDHDPQRHRADQHPQRRLRPPSPGPRVVPPGQPAAACRCRRLPGRQRRPLRHALTTAARPRRAAISLAAHGMPVMGGQVHGRSTYCRRRRNRCQPSAAPVILTHQSVMTDASVRLGERLGAQPSEIGPEPARRQPAGEIGTERDGTMAMLADAAGTTGTLAELIRAEEAELPRPPASVRRSSHDERCGAWPAEQRRRG